MDESKEHYEYAVIDIDYKLIALENDYELARKTAIQNNTCLYILGDCQIGGKELIGTTITRGSCRYVLTLEDLIEETINERLHENYFENLSLLEAFNEMRKDSKNLNTP